MRHLSLLYTAAAGLLAFGLAAAQPKLIPLDNGDFSQGWKGWNIPSGGVELRQMAGTGETYAEISSNDPSKQIYAVKKLPVELMRGKTCLLRYCFKIDKVVQGQKPYNNGRVIVTFRGADRKEKEPAGCGYERIGSCDWEQELRICTIPADAQEVLFHAGLHSTTGKVSIAKVEIIPPESYSKREISPGVTEYEYDGQRISSGNPKVAGRPCGAAAQTAGIKLENGNFSQGWKGWKVPHTTAESGARLLKMADTGKPYAEIYANTPNKGVYAELPLPADKMRGKICLIRFKFKVTDVVKGKKDYNNGRVVIVYRDAAGKEKEPFRCGFERTGTSRWEQALRICTIPVDAGDVRLLAGLHTTTGSVSVTDIEIIPPEKYRRRELAPGLIEYEYDGQHVYDSTSKEYAERHYMEKHLLRRTTVREPDETARKRGFELYLTKRPMEIIPGWKPEQTDLPAEKIRIQAAPNQGTETVFLALRPLKEVKSLAIEVSGLEAETRYGRVRMHRLGYRAWDMLVGYSPKFLEKKAPASLAAGESQLCAVTFNIPDQAAGVVKGKLAVRVNGEAAEIPVELEILPFKLAESKPWQVFYYGHTPERARKDFAQMRKFGITAAILAQCEERPILKDGKIVITPAESEAMIREWEKAGFRQPLIYNPFHDRLLSILIDLHQVGQGLKFRTEYSQKVYYDFKADQLPPVVGDSYREVIRQIDAYAKAHQWPDFIYFAVDEPGDMEGNYNWRTEAANYEHRIIKETIPGMKTFCTNYFPKSIRSMADTLDVTVIPFYFIGNKDAFRRFEMAGYREYCRRHGRPYWGIEWPSMWNGYLRARFTAGFYPASIGLDGMTSWTYYTPRALEPYEDLRYNHKPCHSQCLDEDGVEAPSLQLLGTRDGIIDWRYVGTLENLIAKMPASDKKASLEKRLKALLAKIDMGWISGYSLESDPEEYFLGCKETPDCFRGEVIELLREAVK